MIETALITTSVTILAAYLTKARLWLTPTMFAYFVVSSLCCGVFALSYPAILSWTVLPLYIKEFFLNPFCAYFLFGVPCGLVCANAAHVRRHKQIVLLGCSDDNSMKEMIKAKFVPSRWFSKPITDWRALPYVVAAGSTLISISFWLLFVNAVTHMR